MGYNKSNNLIYKFMKVFVVITSTVSEGEDLGINTKVFRKKERAISWLKEWRDDEISYSQRLGWEIEKDEPTFYSSYLRGEYTLNHSEGYVAELEVM